MDIKAIVNLTSRAWSLPILARMQDGVPGRQAPLLVATGASRTAFAQSMEHLIELGLVERNPGHGHPLRPEFRLTPLGQRASVIAQQVQVIAGEGHVDLLRRSWTLPVLTSLYTPRHFNEIKRNLPIITDRALSLSLQSMEARHWVQRRVDDTARPPRSLYQTINAGALISAVTGSEMGLK